MTDVQPIPVYRPPFLTDGGEFRGQLIESPANIFYQQVKASRATLNRMQFQWRSVSDNLLLSPTVMLRFKLKVTSYQIWSQLMSYVSVHGVAQVIDGTANDAAYTATPATGENHEAAVQVPCIVFADGDAFSSVCSSMNLVYNGTSISLNRTNRFWRDYVRTQVACDDVARIYKAAGGSYDKYDQIPVAVATSGVGDSDMEGLAVGISQDSGISERSKALYAQSEPDGTDGFSRIIQVSYPVPLPPFNPWRGYALPASSPYKNCPLAIPHLSAGQLDFLLEDFEKGFLRRLGSVTHGGADGGAVRLNTSQSALGIALDTTSDCYVELKYFRLSHTRALKESYRFNIWQAQTFLGKAPPTDASSGHRQFGDLIAMDPVGKDAATTTLRSTSAISYSKAGKTWSFEFDTINLAQVPSFLLISCPKLGDSYSLAVDGMENAGGTVIPNAVRNLSHNLYIKQIRIIVNSARGAIEKSSDVDSGYIDAERLWDMTRENANSRYFAEGGFRAWRDHACAILLSSTQFAPGLQACDGVAYPVQIQIEMVVENRSVDVSALTCARNGGANAGAFAGHGNKRCHKLQPDYIRAQAQCTAFYQRVVLATTETAATVNAMNYPLASAERLMNAAGQMR